MPVRGAEAVSPGVASSDDDHVPTARIDHRDIGIALLHAVGKRQELHGLVNAAELTPLDRQVPPDGRAHGNDDGVVASAEVVGSHVYAHLNSRTEPHALGLHLLKPAVEVVLLHLEFGNAVAQ
ncbi:unannotated protein [freshwater metagenome]|uniref:Unannotated protein n=1 Tax=freshwater metagenome TaxID=449393 RepID=A0A6J7LB90_9ZZZZ